MTSLATEIQKPSHFEEALHALEHGNEHVFIHGKAGVGKSTFLQYFREHTKKKHVVLAPTGVAALNVKGQTIHSFFKFKHRFLHEMDTKPKKDNRLYKNLQLVIIDEISMVRADVFDAIEQFLRYNGPKPSEAFGGVQLCVIGDLFQLPPIVGREEREIFYQFYKSPFFFASRAFEALIWHSIHFNTVYRQQDQQFINYLDAIRQNKATKDVFDCFNARLYEADKHDGMPMVRLTTTNQIADQTNQQALDQLEGEAFCYTAKITGEFKAEGKRLPAPEELTLKVGAQVMLTKNDQKKRWINGTLAVVTGLSDQHVDIYIPDKKGKKHFALERESWEQINYHYDASTQTVKEEVAAIYTQFPLILAWAITIHKSQSKTLDRVCIDLGYGAFAPGQLYVALSRCRELEHIYLKKPITSRDIRTDWEVLQFTKKVL